MPSALKIKAEFGGRAPSRDTIVVELPFPPSTNNLFLNVGKRRIPTQRYLDWRRNAAACIVEQRPRAAIGQIEVEITLGEIGVRGRRDIDNGLKAILDCLVSNGIIADDSNKIVRKITAQWGNVIGARVEIRAAG